MERGPECEYCCVFCYSKDSPMHRKLGADLFFKIYLHIWSNDYLIYVENIVKISPMRYYIWIRVTSHPIMFLKEGMTVTLKKSNLETLLQEKAESSKCKSGSFAGLMIKASKPWSKAELATKALFSCWLLSLYNSLSFSMSVLFSHPLQTLCYSDNVFFLWSHIKFQ